LHVLFKSFLPHLTRRLDKRSASIPDFDALRESSGKQGDKEVHAIDLALYPLVRDPTESVDNITLLLSLGCRLRYLNSVLGVGFVATESYHDVRCTLFRPSQEPDYNPAHLDLDHPLFAKGSSGAV
jgi:hypothetical protein